MGRGEFGKAEPAPSAGYLLPHTEQGGWGHPLSHPPQPSGRTCPGVGAAAGSPPASQPPAKEGEGAGEGGGFPAQLAGRCLAARRRPRPDPPAAQPPRHRREINLRASGATAERGPGPDASPRPAPHSPGSGPWSSGAQVSMGTSGSGGGGELLIWVYYSPSWNKWQYRLLSRQVARSCCSSGRGVEGGCQEPGQVWLGEPRWVSGAPRKFGLLRREGAMVCSCASPPSRCFSRYTGILINFTSKR